MDPIAIDLERAARFGRERTFGDASQTAQHTTGERIEGAMSATAEHELFTEALLQAAKQRFGEIRTVTQK
jgi:hypothetical protein